MKQILKQATLAALLLLGGLSAATAQQEQVTLPKPLPTLKVEGRWLTDQHGNHVVLHGVMDTPSAYFNGGRWGWSYSSVTPCINYFKKIFAGLEKARCNVFRLHMDPAWTNDPASDYVYPGSEGQDAAASGEASITKFNPERLTTYLKTLYFPLAKSAMDHRMYVVVRPPGVCPGNLKVGDYYNKYLMTVWDIFTKNDSIRKYSGQISIELANEPVGLTNAEGKDDPKALHDFFQPIVDKIRANGFTGVIWVPGTGWQANYTSYATYPIEGYNIGYAVHDYCGWYGCSDDTPSPENKIKQFHKQVPVVDTNPIIITEVDWSPEKEGTGHYNEHGDWVKGNYGTWATGSTSKWGKAFKATLEELTYADVLLHVIDLSNPEWEAQAEVVDRLIDQLGAAHTPCIRVFNKCDAYLGILPHGENIVCISARSGEGAAELTECVRAILGRADHHVTLLLPYAQGALLETLHRDCAVLHTDYRDDGIALEVIIHPEQWTRFEPFVIAGEEG